MGIESLLTLKEVAELLRVSHKTIYYWVHSSEIPHLKVGRHLRFKEREVIEFFETKTKEAEHPCLSSQPLVNNSLSRSLKTSSESLPKH